MTLPLSDIVYATVQVIPQGVQPPTFNQALIVGNSAILPTYGPNGRCRKYTGGTAILAAMLADGFTIDLPEYKSASFYVQQVPTPYSLWIGRQDATAIGSFNIHAGNAGINYVVGDVVGVTQGGASNALLKVTAVTAGAVTALQFVQQGTGYSVANGLFCTGGSGTGLEIDITSIGESCLQAVSACRIVSPDWYLFNCTAAVDADNIALVGWAQTSNPVSQCFFKTDSPNVLTGVGDIFTTLKAANYNRYQGVYSTTQIVSSVPTAPNNSYIPAALMGLAMGLNTGLANSYFCLPNKTIVGMTVEPVTPSQFAIISGNNGNVYGSYGGVYNSYSPGITGSGQYFDQILTIDMLIADLQYAELSALQIYPAIGQNDAGQVILLHAANVACQKSVARGSLGDGVWNGPTVLALQAGMQIPSYLTQSPSYAQLGKKPANRQSAPIYVAVNLTESVQQVVLAIYVQQ